MCGIFGINTSKPLKDYEIERASKSLALLLHRGPDQSGEYRDGNLYIGHRRLSIMDLSEAGRQPMVSEDGNIVVTVNGEIYNFKSLRAELEAMEYSFKSQSDSEVLLHGYHAWGLETLLEKIDGMYAIIIFDKIKNNIFGVRDRAGIKPLHYGLINDIFSWASELKALVQYYGKENLELDSTALYDFLTYRYIPTPKTAYKNLSKLPPAHYFKFDTISREFSIQRYWILSTEIKNTCISKATKEVRSLIKKTISEQMVADVPVGFFLSGGIDSSIVVTEASFLSNVLHTFTIGFGIKGVDESSYAQMISDLFNTKHTEKVITSKLEKPFSLWLSEIYDEPFADTSALPTWYVSKIARENVLVALSGDGGDELFGGYQWYKRLKLLDKIFRLFKYLPSFILKWNLPYKELVLEGIEAVRKDATPLTLYNCLFFSRVNTSSRELAKKKFNIPDDYDDMWFFRQHWFPELGARRSLQFLDFHTFMPEDVLTKVDRASMCHGLEVRVPFLSRELIEFAFGLPESITYSGFELKGILKRAYKDILPRKILYRKKQGFSVPWNNWKKDLNQSENLQQAVLDTFLSKL